MKKLAAVLLTTTIALTIAGESSAAGTGYTTINKIAVKVTDAGTYRIRVWLEGKSGEFRFSNMSSGDSEISKKVAIYETILLTAYTQNKSVYIYYYPDYYGSNFHKIDEVFIK
ncbi:MAG: hypothetical protein QNJ97_01695 [Myxococcota bacterium]|nr:hypothetical protein [Myxococcota bacterium]